MIAKLIKKWRAFIAPRQLKRAIKHANHIKYSTGMKAMVILTPQGFKAYTKQAIKLLISSKQLRMKIGDIEAKAFYITQ